MSTALNSPEQRCLVRNVPYSAESSGTFIRTTAEERKRYRVLAQLARVELAFADPEHARNERSVHQNARAENLVEVHNADGSSTQLTPEYWRHEWRSLPDYDGPPMRAPSGPVFSRSDGFGIPSAPSAGTELGITQEPDTRRRRPDSGLAGWSQWYLEAQAGDYPDAYAPPSAGGRGWCPKLAGVGE